MTYSHSSSSSFSSSSLAISSSPDILPAAAPLLHPSFSSMSDGDAIPETDKEKLNLFSLTICSPPPMLNDSSEIPPLSMTDEEENSFQIHLQHEMQKSSVASTSACCATLMCCSYNSIRLQFFSLFLCVMVLMLSLFAVFLSSSHRCSMDTNLRRMFLDVTDAFKAHGVEYWLDSGTLLGAVRDGKIIPWEFDLDLGMLEEQCEKLPKLKEYFSARGYELFVRNDYIPYKESKLMGYDGYLHAPCGRIYQDSEYYTDLYWYQTVSKERRDRVQRNEQLKALGQPIISSSSHSASPASRTPPRPAGPSYDSVDLESFITPPWNLSPANDNEQWICSAEGFDPSGMPGGCNVISDVVPTRKMSFLGGQHDIPARPESVLQGVYGDWQTPTPKGYKALFCGALPPTWVSGALAVFSGVVTAACILQLYCQMVCGRRELWATMLKEIKRRLDVYYA